MKLNQFLTTGLLTITLLTQTVMPNTSYASTQPTDISGHWSEPFVTSLVGQGVISGYPDGTFKPDKAITSSEFLSLLLKAVGETPNTAQGGESWDAPIIQSAIQKGIVKSTDDFANMNRELTREETAYMLYNALSVKEDYRYDQCYTPFLDQAILDHGAIDKRYLESVYSMLQKGILTDNANYFYPNQTFTRGAACVVIDRILDKNKRIDPVTFFNRNIEVWNSSFYPKESTESVKVPFENGKPVIDENQVIYELKQHRNNVNAGSLGDFYFYDELIRNNSWGDSVVSQQVAKAYYETAVGAMNTFSNCSYLDDLEAREKKVRYYIVPNAVTDENIKASTQENKDKTMVTEGNFVSDISLFYSASDLTYRTRGRLYFTYKSPSQDTSFYTMHGAEVELKKDQWYYADIEVITAMYLSGGEYSWKTGDYTYGSQQFLTDIIPLVPEK